MGRVAWDGEMILKHLKVHYWTVWNFIWRRIFLERWKGDHSEISSRSRRGTNIWSQDRKHTRFVGSQLIQFRTLHVIRWPALIEEKKYHRLKLRKSWAPENLSIRFGGNTASQQPLPGNKTWEEDNRTSGTWRFNKYTSPFSWSSRSPLGLLGGGSNLTCTGVWATTDYFFNNVSLPPSTWSSVSPDLCQESAIWVVETQSVVPAVRHQHVPDTETTKI